MVVPFLGCEVLCGCVSIDRGVRGNIYWFERRLDCDAKTASATVFFVFLPTALPLFIVVGQGAEVRDTVGEPTAIAILVEFADVRHVTSCEEIREKVFVQMNDYFNTLSHNAVSIKCEVRRVWYQLGKPIGRYAYDGESDLYQYFKPFVAEVIRLADPDIDFSWYKRVIIFHAGSWQQFGNISFCLYGLRLNTNDGVEIDRVQVNAEDDRWIVVAHEFAHQLGHLPDLYDKELFKRREYSSIYAGPWDLMSNDYRYETPSPFAWNLAQLGWLPQKNVLELRLNRTIRVLVYPLQELEQDSLNALGVSLPNGSHYLIEVRLRTKYDSKLPDYGVLVTYVDERIPGGKGPARVQDSRPETPTLDDAAFDLRADKAPVFVDATNDLAVVILQRADSRYVVEVTDYTSGEIAMSAATSLLRADQTISGNHQSIDLFGAKSMLDGAYKYYSIGQYEETRSQVNRALEANENNSVAACLLLAVLLLLIAVVSVYAVRCLKSSTISL